MPHYVPNPENPGQHIDVIELLRRDPHALPPVNIEGLLKRDTWTRQEALLILAGLAPRNVVHGGMPIGTIGAGIVYLDGTTSAQLDAQALEHPRAQEWLREFMDLSGHATGQDMAERKPPGDWLAWAEAKGFTPYWLRLPVGEAATIAGPGAVRHSTKGKRAQPLDAEIEAAKHEATNPSDAHAVYAVLQRWAEERKAPFIGFVEGEGIKYQTPTGEVDFFTFAALRKRMSRAASAH